MGSKAWDGHYHWLNYGSNDSNEVHTIRYEDEMLYVMEPHFFTK